MTTASAAIGHGAGPAPDRAAGRERIVIVGGGLAGHAAAERLREAGFTGTLTIIGEEPHLPYNRTPLSKQLLTGEYALADLPLRSFTDLNVTWRLGCRALALDPNARTIRLGGAEQIGYDGLVIATGVEARVLPGVPMHSERIHMLRTLGDAHRIDQALRRASGRLLIVGGGFIGAELASTARARGLDATIIDVSSTLLTRALGHVLGAAAGDLHRDHGVRLHLGVGVSGWQAHGAGVQLQLADGEVLDGDAAVVGIGTVARTEWLTGSALDCTDGVLAGPTCHAVGADDIVVAGDIARWPNLLFDTTPRRVEHWINAAEMGRHAADSLLAGPQQAAPFTPVPRFWSEQHGVKIQSVGLPTLGSDVRIVHGDLASQRFVAAYTQPTATGDRLMRVVAFDDPRRLLAYAPLVGKTVTASPASSAAA